MEWGEVEEGEGKTGVWVFISLGSGLVRWIRGALGLGVDVCLGHGEVEWAGVIRCWVYYIQRVRLV